MDDEMEAGRREASKVSCVPASSDVFWLCAP